MSLCTISKGSFAMTFCLLSLSFAIPTRCFISLIFHVNFQVSFGTDGDGDVSAEWEEVVVVVVDVFDEGTTLVTG